MHGCLLVLPVLSHLQTLADDLNCLSKCCDMLCVLLLHSSLSHVPAVLLREARTA